MAHGLRRTSLADIAHAAGVSEATLYRRFSSREELLGRLVAREAEEFIALVARETGSIPDPGERLVAAFLLFVRRLRSHDLVQRLLETDPERMLPLLTTDGNAALRLGRGYILAQAQEALAAGVEMTADPEHIAEVLVRLAHSLVLTPQTSLPVQDEARLAGFARATLVPLVFTAPQANPPGRRRG